MNYKHLTNTVSPSTDPSPPLAGLSPTRTTGNASRISVIQYPCGELDVTALNFTYGEAIGSTGGAPRKNTKRSEMDAAALESSIRRAKKTMRQKMLTIAANRLLTLTFRENLTDRDVAFQRFDYFKKLLKRNSFNLQYVGVIEFQKRGAIHFHLAINRKVNYNFLRKLWRQATGDLGGNIDVQNPKNCGFASFNPRRLSGYLTKYLKKAFADNTEFNKRRYFSSKKIIPPKPSIYWSTSKDLVSVLHQLFQKLVGRPPQNITEFDTYWSGYFAST